MFGTDADETFGGLGDMTDRPRAKRPVDVVSNAVHVMRALTGESDDGAPVDDGKDPAAKAPRAAPLAPSP